MDYIKIHFSESLRAFRTCLVQNDKEGRTEAVSGQKEAYEVARDMQSNHLHLYSTRIPIRQYCANGNYLEL